MSDKPTTPTTEPVEIELTLEAMKDLAARIPGAIIVQTGEGEDMAAAFDRVKAGRGITQATGIVVPITKDNAAEATALLDSAAAKSEHCRPSERLMHVLTAIEGTTNEKSK